MLHNTLGLFNTVPVEKVTECQESQVVGDVKGVPDNVEVAPERMDGNGYEKVEKINCVKAVVGLEGIGNGVQREGKCFVYLKHLIDYILLLFESIAIL